MKIDTNRIAHTTWNCTTGKCVGKRLTKAFGCGIIRFGLLKITMKRSAFMTPDFSSAVYLRSRRAYVLQCTFEYLIALLVADAFLAKLLNALDIDDATVGIISSFITLAFTVQILSVLLCRRKMNSKRISTILNCVGHLLFVFLYLTPFLPFRGTGIKMIVMGIILVSYAMRYLVATIVFRWANSFVDPCGRADFSAKKEIISLLCGMAFTASVGYIFGRFESAGKMDTGFLVIAVLVLVLNIANFICFLCIGKEEVPEGREVCGMREVLRETLGNKNFRSVVYLTVLWEMGRYFTVGFVGIYKTKDLAISMFAIQVINICGEAARALLSRPFGKLSDKTSFAHGMEIALGVAAAAFLCLMFTGAATWFLIIPYTVFYAVCLAGLNANSFNITYSYVRADCIAEAMAIKNCIGGLCGFGASLLGSRILASVQGNGNRLFGIEIRGQQVLAICSLLFILGAFLVTHFVIGKQKVLKQ